MFFKGPLALVSFWLIAAAAMTFYIGLFVLARQSVSLRPRRLARWLLIVVAARLSLIPFGYTLMLPWDMALIALVLVAGVGLAFLHHRWLVRSDLESLREQIQMACSRLFLDVTESPSGDFALTAKGNTSRLRIVKLSRRLQLVTVPAAGGTGKVSLLVRWFSKQYPGPVPRFLIVLKKE